jgi:hypothetical protein
MSLKSVEFNTDRSQILHNFADRFAWVPHWAAEVTMAEETLEAQITEVDRFAGSLAIISTMAEADKYRVEAQAEIEALRVPMLHNKGIYPVNFDLIHGDDIVIGAMARHLLFVDSLKRDKWPVHTEPRLEKKTKPYKKLVRNLSTVRRTGLWRESLESETTRELHWVNSILTAHSSPNVMNAIASQKKDAPVAESA